MPETSPSRLATARIPLVIAAVVIGGLIGYAGMVGMGGIGASGGDPSCRPASSVTGRAGQCARREQSALA